MASFRTARARAIIPPEARFHEGLSPPYLGQLDAGDSLAILVAVCTAVPAWASGSGYSIVVKGTSGGHVLEAYQLFSGNVATNDSLGFELRNPGWGSGVAPEGQQALGNAAARYATLDSPAAGRRFAQDLVAHGWLDSSAAVRSVYNSDTASFVIHHLEPGLYLVMDASSSDAD